MSKNKEKYLSDPVGGFRQIQVMESGLTHCSDSMAGGIKGEVHILFGAPGDPMERSNGVKSNLYGRSPDLFKKFQKRDQR